MKYYSYRVPQKYVTDNSAIIINRHTYTKAKYYLANAVKLLPRIYFEIVKRKELKT